MKTKFNVSDVRKLMDGFDAQLGVDSSMIPIVSVKRAVDSDTALASYVYQTYTFEAIRFEFTEKCLNVSEDFLFEIVAHEYAHWVRNTERYQGNYSHDEVFAEIVAELGGTCGGAHVPAWLMDEMITSKRYVLRCEHCYGAAREGYQTRCKRVKQAENGEALCPVCGRPMSVHKH